MLSRAEGRGRGCSVPVPIAVWGLSCRDILVVLLKSEQERWGQSQKADGLLLVMSRKMFGISEPSAVHLLSALSPTLASSVWNSPEELSNNLIDSTAVNWRIPHFTHGKSVEKPLKTYLFPKCFLHPQKRFYIVFIHIVMSSDPR